MNRLLFIASLATATVALSGCFGFSAGGVTDFRPGEDWEPTGNTVHLKAAVADLVMHEVYPGFHANLWAFCMGPADPSDEYSANAIEAFNPISTDGTITGEDGSIDGVGTDMTCSVPAPTLRVKQGDLVKVDFANNHFHSHTIHWHGQYVPWLHDGVPGVTQDSVQPGETFEYEFVASRAGTLWYHCHVDVQFHVMQGLYGMFIVEPQEDKWEPEDIDKEYSFVYGTLNRDLVQVTPETAADPHILHRHKGGECGASGVQGCQNPAVDTTADTWMLNGRSAPHTFMDEDTSVIKVNEGERVRVRLLNAGETFETIHTHGHDMYVTHRDGNPLPPSSRFWVDTLTIGPAERYDVVIEMDNPGIWVMHSHVDHHVTNDHMNPGGPLTAIAYESALEQTGGVIRSFAAEAPGGLPWILPLEIPLDVQYGADRNIGNSLTGGGTVSESWSFPWELPCATRHIEATITFDPETPSELSGLAVQDLNVAITYNGASGAVVQDNANPEFVNGVATWTLDGRFDALASQSEKDATAGVRASMIEDYKIGEYTITVSGTSVPADLHFHVAIDYHASEEDLYRETVLASLDVNKGEGDCSQANRVFDPSA